MNEPNTGETRTYVLLGEISRRRVEAALPIHGDEGEVTLPNGMRRSRIEDEMWRLNKVWYTFQDKTDRRLGVGNEVVVGKGTPLRVESPFISGLGDYVADEDIHGVLTEETTEYPVDRPINPNRGMHRSNLKTEWVKRTNSLFTVTVQMPPADPSVPHELATQVKILVPNDMVQLASKE